MITVVAVSTLLELLLLTISSLLCAISQYLESLLSRFLTGRGEQDVVEVELPGFRPRPSQTTARVFESI